VIRVGDLRMNNSYNCASFEKTALVGCRALLYLSSKKRAVIHIVKDRFALGGVDLCIELGGQASV
jgi:hypothetical protein